MQVGFMLNSTVNAVQKVLLSMLSVLLSEDDMMMMCDMNNK